MPTKISLSLAVLFSLSVATVFAISGARRIAAAPAKERFSPAQLVDALHAAFGKHHARAVHTKGVILEGTFTPDPAAAALTKAAHLQRTPSKVVVRFSDFTGLPDIPDNAPPANPRGLAVRFTLPDGQSTDLVGHSFDGFPTQTADQFRELLLAIAASGPGAAAPTALDRFLEAHPVARRFLTTQKTPASFATIAYFGVNAFRFTARDGSARYIRYQLEPIGGEQLLTGEQAAAQGARYLQDEVAARVAKASFAFRMYAQVADPGDAIDDPSIAWPAQRTRVPLGVLTVARLADNTAKADQALAFSPRNLLPGIETADPMLDFRARAYPISVEERRR